MSQPPLRKMDIVKLLRKKHGLDSFLEISTRTTGFTFSEIAGVVPHAQRLAYNCPAEFDDGQKYTYRTDALTSGEIAHEILAANKSAPCYDILFVDPFHTYECSAIDLTCAFALLRPGGFMVVHDCNPEDQTLTSPDYVEGAWMGLTYAAFIDFTLRPDISSFYTVDTDFGCGVVYKGRSLPDPEWPPDKDTRRRLAAGWRATSHDYAARFDFFAQNRRALLHLKSVDEFAAFEGVSLADVMEN
jgi:hypothetical protein